MLNIENEYFQVKDRDTVEPPGAITVEHVTMWTDARTGLPCASWYQDGTLFAVREDHVFED
jgi:phage antirepressor YoqD-like protein